MVPPPSWRPRADATPNSTTLGRSPSPDGGVLGSARSPRGGVEPAPTCGVVIAILMVGAATTGGSTHGRNRDFHHVDTSHPCARRAAPSHSRTSARDHSQAGVLQYEVVSILGSDTSSRQAGLAVAGAVVRSGGSSRVDVVARGARLARLRGRDHSATRLIAGRY